MAQVGDIRQGAGTSTTAVPQPRPDWQNDWQQLLSYLPENYEQLAREHKMLEVQYGNAKTKTAQDLLRFVFVHVGCDLPLRQSVAVVGAAGGPKLSAMRLHKKMQRSPSPALEADEHPASRDDRRALALQAERPARRAAEHHAAA